MLWFFSLFQLRSNTDTSAFTDVEDTVPDKKKKKGTFREGFAIMRNSPKIMNLALLVIGYSVSHRLFDVAWKGQLSIVYPEPQQYQAALADVSVWTGAATIISMVTGKFVFQVSGGRIGFCSSLQHVVVK